MAVHLDMKLESILHDLIQEVVEAERSAPSRRMRRKICARGAAKNAILAAIAAPDALKGDAKP